MYCSFCSQPFVYDYLQAVSRRVPSIWPSTILPAWKSHFPTCPGAKAGDLRLQLESAAVPPPSGTPSLLRPFSSERASERGAFSSRNSEGKFLAPELEKGYPGVGAGRPGERITRTSLPTHHPDLFRVFRRGKKPFLWIGSLVCKPQNLAGQARIFLPPSWLSCLKSVQK